MANATEARSRDVDPDVVSYLILLAASVWVLIEAARTFTARWAHRRLLWFASAGIALGLTVLYAGLIFGWAPWLWRPVLLAGLVTMALGYHQDRHHKGHNWERRRDLG